jgi:hypothetical protein
MISFSIYLSGMTKKLPFQNKVWDNSFIAPKKLKSTQTNLKKID